jgi:hypothetical protein
LALNYDEQQWWQTKQQAEVPVKAKHTLKEIFRSQMAKQQQVPTDQPSELELMNAMDSQ